MREREMTAEQLRAMAELRQSEAEQMRKEAEHMRREFETVRQEAAAREREAQAQKFEIREAMLHRNAEEKQRQEEAFQQQLAEERRASKAERVSQFSHDNLESTRLVSDSNVKSVSKRFDDNSVICNTGSDSGFAQTPKIINGISNTPGQVLNMPVAGYSEGYSAADKAFLNHPPVDDCAAWSLRPPDPGGRRSLSAEGSSMAGSVMTTLPVHPKAPANSPSTPSNDAIGSMGNSASGLTRSAPPGGLGDASLFRQTRQDIFSAANDGRQDRHVMFAPGLRTSEAAVGAPIYYATPAINGVFSISCE
jgi:hypothetical protein